MFGRQSDIGHFYALDGTERKILIHGDRTLMTEFRLCQGAILPLHAHPPEQTGYLVKGHIRIGSRTGETTGKDQWSREYASE